MQTKQRKELDRINKAYCDVKQHGWRAVRGEQNCDGLADLTILIESPNGSAVYTTDKDYNCLYHHLDFPEKQPPVIEKY